MGYKKKDKEKIYFLFFLVFLASGCAATCLSSLNKKITEDKESGIILNVPFVKQKKSFCGPAALSSVFSYWGDSLSQEEIAKDIYQPKLCGVLNIELVRYARENGFWTQDFKGDFKLLKEKLKNDIPVIVMEKLHPYILNKLHYCVIVGFLEKEKIIIEHTGKNSYVQRSYNGFLRNWQAAGSWMLVVVPPEKVNWQLNADEEVELGLLLEKKGDLPFALKRYQKALEIKQNNHGILFNIGNIYLKMKQWDEAEKVYLEVIRLKADFADAYNNLAYAYFNKNEFEKAHQYVDKALSFNSKHRFYYLDTKAQIFFAEGKIEPAIDFFHQAESKMEDIPPEVLADFYKNWAENFKKMGQEQKKEELLKKMHLFKKKN